MTVRKLDAPEPWRPASTCPGNSSLEVDRRARALGISRDSADRCATLGAGTARRRRLVAGVLTSACRRPTPIRLRQSTTCSVPSTLLGDRRQCRAVKYRPSHRESGPHGSDSGADGRGLAGRTVVTGAGRERKRAVSLTISAPACADSPSRFRSCCWLPRLPTPPSPRRSGRQPPRISRRARRPAAWSCRPAVVPGMKSTEIALDARSSGARRRRPTGRRLLRHRRSGAHLRGRYRQRRRARAAGRDAGGVLGHRAGRARPTAR